MENRLEFDIESTEGLAVPAGAIVRALGKFPVAAFYGGMGAGKTTLIREIARALGVTDTVTSPTFAIVNAYGAPNDGQVYHFDFYRIDNHAEAFDLGYEEYVYSGEPCLIEWPEKIEPLLPEDTLRVNITQSPGNPSGRHITITIPER